MGGPGQSKSKTGVGARHFILFLLVQRQLGLPSQSCWGRNASKPPARIHVGVRPNRRPVCASMHPSRQGKRKRNETRPTAPTVSNGEVGKRKQTAQARGKKTRRLEVLNLEESDDAVTGFLANQRAFPTLATEVGHQAPAANEVAGQAHARCGPAGKRRGALHPLMQAASRSPNRAPCAAAGRAKRLRVGQGSGTVM